MNLRFIKNPCRYCDKRGEGCHSRCEAYIDFRKKYDAEVQRQNKERYIDVQLIDMRKDRENALRRKYGKKRR